MAEELQYGSGADSAVSNKRKYEDQTPPPSGTRRQTGFSAPISSQSPPAPQSYNSVPPPLDEIQLAKQKAQEIAARLFNSADPKRPRVDNGGSGFDSTDNKGFISGPIDFVQKPMVPNLTPSVAGSYGYPGPTKKIEIPNGRVGVVIGKAGETIKYLQLQSGAKIQVTRDAEADPNSVTRSVELTGTAEAIAKAEQLINDVLAEAETGGTGVVSRRLTGQQSGAEQFVMKILNEKVGLVIGKGGETIKSMQARSGARIQVIPLHLPPGDTSKERTVQIDGSSEQIEMAKQLVNEVINENRQRNPPTAGVYPQQYQAHPTSWPPGPPMQQPGYGYPQQGGYPTQPPYTGYPPQATSGGYATGWDQTTAPPNQHNTQGGGYDYYQQPPPQQQQPGGGSSAPMDNTGYYSQQPVGYNQQGYSQDGYGGYHAPAPHSGYGQPTPSQISGYDQQQGYNAATGYGNVANPASESHTPSFGAQGDTNQAPPAPSQSTGMGQQGYSTDQQTSSTPSYPSQGSSQPGYGISLTSQAGYGTQPPSGYGPSYGPPPAQKPPANQPGYGQPQQSPNAQGGYGQPPMQAAYQHTQPGSLQSGYGTNQSGYAPSPYGAPSVTQPSDGQQQPPAYNSSYAGVYSQPPVYSADGNARGTYDAAPTSQAAQPGAAKASPKS